MGFRVSGSGFRIQGLGFCLWEREGLGFRELTSRQVSSKAFPRKLFGLAAAGWAVRCQAVWRGFSNRGSRVLGFTMYGVVFLWQGRFHEISPSCYFENPSLPNELGVLLACPGILRFEGFQKLGYLILGTI